MCINDYLVSVDRDGNCFPKKQYIRHDSRA